jgi:tetraacyldisaccharide 4'-kinase
MGFGYRLSLFCGGIVALKTPKWFYDRNAKGAPWWRFSLWPLSVLWRVVTENKLKNTTPYRAALQVISVGNLTVGGSGKTPVVSELLRLLETQHKYACGLSRGYGAALSGPIMVERFTHTASDVGDEPLMIAQTHNFMIARDRVIGLKTLEAAGFKVVVLDDAHQNPTMTKDVSIVVIDADTSANQWPFGDGAIMPYGPLREPLATGLARADLVVFWLPDGHAKVDPALLATIGDKPFVTAHLMAQATPQIVIAFAGIAKPWKFENTLKSNGYDIINFHAFADHEPFDDQKLCTLFAAAKLADVTLITTEKDWMRLSFDWRKKIKFLPITAKFDDEETLLNILKSQPSKP